MPTPKKRYKKNESYWRKRAFDLQNKSYDRADKYLKDLNAYYELARQRIDEKIYSQVEKLARKNGQTIDEAIKYINARERQGLIMDLEDYIALGKKGNWPEEIIAEMEEASTMYHINYYQGLGLELEGISAKLWHDTKGPMKGFLADEYTKTYYRMVKDLQDFTGRYERVLGVNKRGLEAILEEPWAPDKKPFSTRIWNNQSKLVSNLKRELALCLSGTQGLEGASKNIAHAMDVSYSNARRLVYGELSHALNRASLESMKTAKADGYRYVATLDSKTTSFCRSLDGKIFKLEDYREGVTAPPHPGGNCRSYVTAYYEGDYENTARVRLAKRPDGSYVEVRGSDKLTFKEWEDKYLNVKQT